MASSKLFLMALATLLLVVSLGMLLVVPVPRYNTACTHGNQVGR